MKKEARDIAADAIKTTWYMRGGMSYSEAMMLSYDDRMTVNELIKENLDTTRKTGLNFF
jgi:hypothetical protein